MKTLLLFISLFTAAACSSAQEPKKVPLAIPPYHILTTDSVNATPANLKKNKAVMIIYFSPDCSHCQHLMYEMKPYMKDFKNIQVVMITFVKQIEAIKVFYRDFDLKNYPNFTVGTEGYTMLVQRYYDVHNTPYIALYDKDKKLVKTFEKAPKMEELTAAVKGL